MSEDEIADWIRDASFPWIDFVSVIVREPGKYEGDFWVEGVGLIPHASASIRDVPVPGAMQCYLPKCYAPIWLVLGGEA
jgi:hypothetical protein